MAAHFSLFLQGCADSRSDVFCHGPFGLMFLKICFQVENLERSIFACQRRSIKNRRMIGMLSERRPSKLSEKNSLTDQINSFVPDFDRRNNG
jgi:hypothetical protein